MEKWYCICPRCHSRMTYVIINRTGLNSVYRFSEGKLFEEVRGNGEALSDFICPKCHAHLGSDKSEVEERMVLDEQNAVAEVL